MKKKTLASRILAVVQESPDSEGWEEIDFDTKYKDGDQVWVPELGVMSVSKVDDSHGVIELLRDKTKTRVGFQRKDLILFGAKRRGEGPIRELPFGISTGPFGMATRTVMAAMEVLGKAGTLTEMTMKDLLDEVVKNFVEFYTTFLDVKMKEKLPKAGDEEYNAVFDLVNKDLEKAGKSPESLKKEVRAVLSKYINLADDLIARHGKTAAVTEMTGQKGVLGYNPHQVILFFERSAEKVAKDVGKWLKEYGQNWGVEMGWLEVVDFYVQKREDGYSEEWIQNAMESQMEGALREELGDIPTVLAKEIVMNLFGKVKALGDKK